MRVPKRIPFPFPAGRPGPYIRGLKLRWERERCIADTDWPLREKDSLTDREREVLSLMLVGVPRMLHPRGKHQKRQRARPHPRARVQIRDQWRQLHNAICLI